MHPSFVSCVTGPRTLASATLRRRCLAGSWSTCQSSAQPRQATDTLEVTRWSFSVATTATPATPLRPQGLLQAAASGVDQFPRSPLLHSPAPRRDRATCQPQRASNDPMSSAACMHVQGTPSETSCLHCLLRQRLLPSTGHPQMYLRRPPSGSSTALRLQLHPMLLGLPKARPLAPATPQLLSQCQACRRPLPCPVPAVQAPPSRLGQRTWTSAAKQS